MRDIVVPATPSSPKSRPATARISSVGAPSTGRALPASDAVDLRPGLDPDALIWDETLVAGGYAGHLLPRDAVLRVTDLHGDGSLHLIVHDAHRPSERLNVADTVKVQWQAYLGP